MNNESRDSAYNEMLDEAVERIRALPVPDDPGMNDLQLSAVRPARDCEPKSKTGSGFLAMAAVAVALLVAALGVLPMVRHAGQRILTDAVEEQVKELEDQTPVIAKIVKVLPAEQYVALEDEVTELATRLDRLDELIARQEFLSETKLLLAAYRLPVEINQ